jgi:predicted nucleic acid-binding protein
MAKSIIIDSCFWFALFDNRDPYHEDAMLFYEYIVPHTLVLPWPTLYEALNTRFSRRRASVEKFYSIIRTHSTYLVPDNEYRDISLEYFFNQRRPFSLVDIVIRNIILDESIKIDAIVTFNEADFIDICSKRGIELFNG